MGQIFLAFLLFHQVSVLFSIPLFVLLLVLYGQRFSVFHLMKLYFQNFSATSPLPTCIGCLTLQICYNMRCSNFLSNYFRHKCRFFPLKISLHRVSRIRKFGILHDLELSQPNPNRYCHSRTLGCTVLHHHSQVPSFH